MDRGRRSYQNGGPAFVVAALIAGAGAPGLASASDFSHTCRTAGGLYEMDNEALHQPQASGEPGPDIAYRKLGETVIQSESGYCLSNDAGDRRFAYESKTYTLEISVDVEGAARRLTMLCELASNGMPAMYNCDKQVTLTSQGAKALPQGGTGHSLWSHNGSLMRLEADGAKRTIVYERPRSGMRRAGAESNAVLFEGQRTGDRYSGVARIFATGCAPAQYPVVGSVSPDERRIILRGDAPRLNDQCVVKGVRPDVLIFTYQGTAGN